MTKQENNNESGSMELEKVLSENNNKNRDYPTDKCFQQVFDELVKNKGDQIALEFHGKKMSYRELNEKANQLAHYLNSIGIKPGMFVGVLFERSFELMIGLLGVIKSGASFIPLDPVYPKDRIEYMLQLCEGQWVVSHDSVLSEFTLDQVQVINIDRESENIDNQPMNSPTLQKGLSAESLMYAIFTSGSTGKPKGIPITHCNFQNFIHSMFEQAVIEESDRMIAMTTVSFDMAIIEIFGPLLLGGTLIIATKEHSVDSYALLDLIRVSKANTMIATPVTWRLLLAAGWSEHDKLKVLSAGEALPAHLASELYARSTALWNLYGPTETTVIATTYKIESEEQIPKVNKNIVIGKPIENTSIYILSPDLKKVPLNEEGEVHISGVGLSPGYLGRDDLTKNVFIPNPFSDIAGDRLYKTGDLAVLLPDGNIEYRGRIDHQVKIRGFRIELGEIDIVLKEFETVQDCVVAVKEFGRDDKRLVGYYIPKPNEKVELKQLRCQMEEQLPDYMVPSFFVEIDKIPLTANLKVDRKALPMPMITRENLGDDFVAPKSEIEQQLANVWSNIFQVEGIGSADNFFHMGGQSMLAADLSKQIDQLLYVKLSIRDIFINPTITQMATLIESRSKVTTPKIEETKLELPEGIDRKNNLPIRFHQIDYWFSFKNDKETDNAANIYLINGDLNQDAFEKALNETAKSSEAIWTSFSETMPLQTVNSPEWLQIPIVSLEGKDEKQKQIELDQFYTGVLHKPFDLTKAPQIRTMLIKIEKNSYQFLLSMPHIISDEKAQINFIKQLLSHYKGIITNKPLSNSINQDVTFKAVYKERTESHINRMKEDLKYWEKRLTGAKLVDFPVDYFYETTKPSGKNVLEIVPLPETWLKQLIPLNQQNAGTFQMVIVSMIQVLFYILSQQLDTMVGMVASLDQEEDNSPDKDFMVTAASFLPIRSQLNESDQFSDILRQVRDVELEGMDHTRCMGIIPMSLSTKPYLTGSFQKFFSKLLEWIMRFQARSWEKKVMPHGSIFSLYSKFILSTISQLNKEKTRKRLILPPMVNILSEFYNPFQHEEGTGIELKPILNHELIQEPGTFEGNGGSALNKMLVFDVTRNAAGEAQLYIYGGGLKPTSLKKIASIFQYLMNEIIKSPHSTLVELRNNYQQQN